MCATVIKADAEHVGLKNRCVECQTKFVIPENEEDEIEILERGEAPTTKVTRVQVRKAEPKPLVTRPQPKTTPIRKPVTENAEAKKPGGPKKLLTSRAPLRAPTNAPSRKISRALPQLNPKTEAPKVPAKKKIVRRRVVKKKISKKHSLEHLPALAPDPPHEERKTAALTEATPPGTEKVTPPEPEETKAPPQIGETPPKRNAPAPSSTNPEAPAGRKVTRKVAKVAKPRPKGTTKHEPANSSAPKTEPVAKKTDPIEAQDSGAPKLRTGADRPLPGRGVQGSFHDLKVKRTQRDTRGIVQAVAVLSVCLIVGIILVASRGGQDDETTVEAAANLPAEEPAPIAPPPIPAPPTPGPEHNTEPEVALVNHWEDVIQPYLENYCLDCHDEANEEGGLELERFHNEKLALTEPHIWEKAAQLVRMDEMPPRDRFDRPDDKERAQFIAWVKSVSERWDSGEFGRDPGRTTIRRMTKNEYNYSMRDLFGLKLRPADNFPEDGGGEDGFDNNADALFLPPLLMENYVEAAGLLVNAIYKNQESYQRWLFAFPHGEGSKEAAARKVLEHWAPLIYRRPVESQEIESLVSILRFQMEKKKKEYREAMKMPLLALLISPHFLYRSEEIQPGGKPYPVEDIDLASRLSYFLWSSTPDGQLLKLASEGKLSDPSVYEAQVRRMLMDDRARSLGMHFGGQWLKWEDLRSRANPDRKRFPNFDFALRVSMYRESSLFFDNLLREDLSILDLIDSDYSFLNQKLAIHYDIPGVTGTGLTKVKLDDPNRGGVIGMASVLTATSLPLRSSPAKRGNYLLTELLGTPPPAPPMNVPQLPEDDEEIEFKSFRDALTEHRENPSCKSCHEAIDPMGFGMENYDAIGRWRQYQNDTPVDSAGTLPNGEKFSNPKELKALLMKRKDLFTRNMVEKALAYGLGRELTPYDRQVAKSITDKVIADGYKAQTLFLEVARSYPFLNCRGDDFSRESQTLHSN